MLLKKPALQKLRILIDKVAIFVHSLNSTSRFLDVSRKRLAYVTSGAYIYINLIKDLAWSLRVRIKNTIIMCPKLTVTFISFIIITEFCEQKGRNKILQEYNSRSLV